MSKLALMLAISMIFLGNSKPLAQDSSRVTGSFNSTVVSKSLPFGYGLGEGPNQNNTISFDYKNFNAFMWSNYDFGSQKTLENDYGIGYSKELGENSSVSGGLMHWSYLDNGHDNVANVSLNHSGNLDKSISYFYFFPKENSKSAHALNLNVSKGFDLTNDLSLTPNLDLVYLNNTFGGDTGLAKISSGVDATYDFGNFSASFFLNGQLGFIEETRSGLPLENASQLGVSFTASF